MKSLSDAKFLVINSINRTSNKNNKNIQTMILNFNFKRKMNFHLNQIDRNH